SRCSPLAGAEEVRGAGGAAAAAVLGGVAGRGGSPAAGGAAGAAGAAAVAGAEGGGAGVTAELGAGAGGGVGVAGFAASVLAVGSEFPPLFLTLRLTRTRPTPRISRSTRPITSELPAQLVRGRGGTLAACSAARVAASSS